MVEIIISIEEEVHLSLITTTITIMKRISTLQTTVMATMTTTTGKIICLSIIIIIILILVGKRDIPTLITIITIILSIKILEDQIDINQFLHQLTTITITTLILIIITTRVVY